jgi:SET domain-containing protein
VSNLSYISPKAAVRESAIHGRGLFAVAPFARGEIVCVKGGYIFDRETLKELQPRLGAAEIQIGEDLFIGPVAEAERDGAMIFSNHSCEPNIGVAGQIVFVALREIEAGEELTHDWATTDDDDYEMECRCGAETCRRVITGQDWRRKELQEKYGEHISSYLREKIRRGES